MDYDKTSKAERIPLKRKRKPVDILDLLISKKKNKDRCLIYYYDSIEEKK